MRTFYVALVVLAVFCVAGGTWTQHAVAQAPPGCASGAAPGQVVYSVGVSATGKPFVTPYVSSAPTAGGNAGCAAPSPTAGPTFILNGPGVAPYPQLPVGTGVPPTAAPSAPTTVNVVPVGPNNLIVPHNPSLQLYQIAPGYYVIRSLDPAGNTNVMLPVPPAPQAPNTGPIPSIFH
jgi:hypothetical protein